MPAFLCAEKKLSDGFYEISPMELTWKEAKVAIGRVVTEIDQVSALPTERTFSTEGGTGIMQISDCSVVFSAHAQTDKTFFVAWKAGFILPKDQKREILRLKLSSERIRRTIKPEPVIILHGQEENGKPAELVVCNSSEVFNSGESHEVLVRLPAGFFPESIEVRMTPVRSSAELELEGLAFAGIGNAVAKTFGNIEPEVAVSEASFLNLENPFTVNLEQVLRKQLAEPFGKVVEGAGAFLRDIITVEDIHFRVASGRMNLIAPPNTGPTPEDKIEVLGESIPRRRVFRPSREDAIEVPVRQNVSEVYLLLASDLRATANRYSLAAVPARLSDIDAFAVELVYSDGIKDLAFPYSVADGGFVIQRMLGAYAVPADIGRKLERIRILNRIFDENIYLAAISVNASTEQRFSKVWHPEMKPSLPVWEEPSASSSRSEQTTHGVIIENRYFKIELGLRDGFSIKSVQQKFDSATALSLGEKSGFIFHVENQTLYGSDFLVKENVVEDTNLQLVLVPKDSALPIQLDLKISFSDESPQLRWEASVVNTSKNEVNASLVLPWLENVSFGDIAAMEIFFPQYRSVLTQDEETFLAKNDSAFPVQFFSVFDSLSGLGLSFLTENTQGEFLRYSAAKFSTGCTLGIEHPSDFLNLKPEETKVLVTTNLLFHQGGWKNAMTVYREWKEKTFVAHHAENRQWFLDTFYLQTQYPGSEKVARSITTLSAFINKSTHQFRSEEFLALDKAYLGITPDIVHFFAFNGDDTKEELMHNWGEWATPGVFERLGGVENVQQNINALRDKYSTKVSIYTLPDRFSPGTPVAEKYSEKFGLRKEDGTLAQHSRSIGVNIANPEWLQWYAGEMKNLQETTGADAIYLDVFPYHYRKTYGYDKNGNLVLLNRIRASLDSAREIRKVLSPTTAIWSEYAPQDFVARYLDGAIVYQYLTLFEHFTGQPDRVEKTPLETDLCFSVSRFTQPEVKGFFFPVGGEAWPGFSSNFKQVFFFGDGILNTAYFLFPERPLEFFKEGLKIAKEYADCFTSLHPEPLIPTLKARVYANAFPGENRTMFTVLNASFITSRGETLAVPHLEGATYLNARTNEVIIPEIQSGQAILSLTIEPQDVAFIVQK